MEGFSKSYQNGRSQRETDLQGLVQNIAINIQKILQNVSSIQRMMVQLGTPQDNQQLQNQLHQVQHFTGKLAKDTTTNLQDLVKGVSTLSPSEQRIWRLQKERLQSDFTRALNNFQDTQRLVAKKEKELLQRARNAPSNLQSIQVQKNLIDIEDGHLQGEVQKYQQIQMQEHVDLEQLQERQRAFNQLESDILDVNTIFKDLAMLVHDQGDMIDSIEANVESTHVTVQDATEQLRHAENYQTRARKKKLFIGLVSFIIIVIITAILASQ